MGTASSWTIRAGETLEYGGVEARLEPGATLVVQVAGTMWDPTSGLLTFAARVLPSNGDWNLADNAFTVTAPVTMAYGDFGGAVVEDKNGNGLPDPGEAVPDIRVFLYGGSPYRHYERVTDVHGRFFFDDIPTGRYSVGYFSEAGWLVGPDYPEEQHWITDDPSGVDVVVFAVRPLSDKLLVTAEFQQATYQVGDMAYVSMTIRNRTGTTLTGIHAHCNGVGNSNQLNGVGPGWAEFDQSGPGVTLAAGETRTFNVYEAVPEGALYYGYVAMSCEIGPGAGSGGRGNPYVRARAKVPGMTSDVDGRIVYDVDGNGWIEDEGLADAFTGVTDAEGRFSFHGIPAGTYVVRVIGPWQPVRYQSMEFDAQGGFPSSGWVFSVEPRDSQSS